MIYSVGKNERRDFYQLWQQHKELKTVDMNKASPDTFNTIEHLVNDPKTIKINTRIIISFAMIRGIPFEFEGKSMETETTT